MRAMAMKIVRAEIHREDEGEGGAEHPGEGRVRGSGVCPFQAAVMSQWG